MGIVVQFPRRFTGQFTPEMRGTLTRHAAAVPGALPLTFGKDNDGTEFCALANGLMITWDRQGRLIVIDTNSGYVDGGPFQSVDEIGLILAYIAA